MVTTDQAPPEAENQGAVLARRLVIAAAAAVALAAFTYLLMVRTRLGQRFDNAALLGATQQSPSSRLHDVFFLERIRAGTFTLVLVAIAVIGAVRRRARAGLALAAGALIAVLGTDLAKNVILSRPLLVATDFGQRANTFPSGHTATAIAVALALVVLSPPALRGFVAILAGSYSWIVAADVQTVGWHRPSDAIGASLLAFATIALVAALLARSRPIGTGNRYGDLAALPLLGLVWLISAATSVLSASRSLAILVTTADSARPRGALLNDAYEFSVNLTVAVVVSLLIVLLLLVGKNDLDQPGRPS